MKNLNFISKSRSSMGPYAMDVRVSHSYSANKNRENCEATYFTFRNGSEEKIAPNTYSIAYAVSGTRVYFKEVNSSQGYTLSKNEKNHTDNRYVTITGPRHNDLHRWSEAYAGEYDLLYDSNLNLWCIDVNGVLFRGKEE